MNLALRIDNNIIAVIISIIFLNNISSRIDKKEIQNKAFINIFVLNAFQVANETLTCIINRQPYTWLIPTSNFLHIFLYILGPFITYKWYVFASLWIKKDTEYKYKNDIYILIPLVINTLLVLLSPLLKLTFYIDEYNIYHRGSLFFIPASISYFYLLCGFILIYVNRKKINRIEFLPLLLFGVFPAICGLIQVLFYGFLLMWSSITYSLIILYFYLQQQMIHIDYLTGAWTRERFYNHLVNRIQQKKPKKFSIVFIDLDDFKAINDNFGHNEGDRALINVVHIIKDILSNDDIITRYGGDEFILLLNVESQKDVENIIRRISLAFDNYNMTSDAPYKLKFSYGYESYDFDTQMKADEYINHVDKLMYQNKNSKKLLH